MYSFPQSNCGISCVHLTGFKVRSQYPWSKPRKPTQHLGQKKKKFPLTHTLKIISVFPQKPFYFSQTVGLGLLLVIDALDLTRVKLRYKDQRTCSGSSCDTVFLPSRPSTSPNASDLQSLEALQECLRHSDNGLALMEVTDRKQGVVMDRWHSYSKHVTDKPQCNSR